MAIWTLCRRPFRERQLSGPVVDLPGLPRCSYFNACRAVEGYPRRVLVADRTRAPRVTATDRQHNLAQGYQNRSPSKHSTRKGNADCMPLPASSPRRLACGIGRKESLAETDESRTSFDTVVQG